MRPNRGPGPEELRKTGGGGVSWFILGGLFPFSGLVFGTSRHTLSLLFFSVHKVHDILFLTGADKVREQQLRFAPLAPATFCLLYNNQGRSACDGTASREGIRRRMYFVCYHQEAELAVVQQKFYYSYWCYLFAQRVHNPLRMRMMMMILVFASAYFDNLENTAPERA